MPTPSYAYDNMYKLMKRHDYQLHHSNCNTLAIWLFAFQLKSVLANLDIEFLQVALNRAIHKELNIAKV